MFLGFQSLRTSSQSKHKSQWIWIHVQRWKQKGLNFMEYFQIICPAQKRYRFKETYLQNHIFRGHFVCFFPSVLKAVPTRSNISAWFQIHIANNTFSGSPICFSNFSWGIFWLGKSLTQALKTHGGETHHGFDLNIAARICSRPLRWQQGGVKWHPWN